MTKITTAEVAKIAKLSALKLEPEEQLNLANELSDIVDWVEKLNEVNTAGVKPMFAVFEELRLVADEETIISEEEKNSTLDLACDRVYDFYAVPKVINENE